MNERLPPSISISCDDLNTKRGLDNIARTGLPIHGDVIVTLPGVGRFVAENRQSLAKVEPGVHVSLFEGDFPKDSKGLFGPRGRLHFLLHEIEDPKKNKFSRYRHWFNIKTRHMISGFVSDIHGEINRQIDVWKGMYGELPHYLSYHFGMHYIPLVHEVYAKAAQERGIPYRHAAQYTGLPKKYDLAVADSLNDKWVTPQRMLVVLDKIRRKGRETDVMTHLGNWEYGDAQVRMFNDMRVRQELANWRIEMPHVIWQRLQDARQRRYPTPPLQPEA
ncbi:ChbG/HpnK family deacetylase [Candidatus Gottesmanbacteria bacterium]|nr:ChbG/HpnK family deacetylase [Candidatus Gottesmanbacteria bacterium]